MEGESSLSDIMNQQMICDLQDLLLPTQYHHHLNPPFNQLGSEVQPQSNSVFPAEYTQEQAVSVVNYNENERGKSLVSDDHAMNCAVTGVDGHIEDDKEGGTPWQRAKWEEKMIRILITAAYYIGQCASAETGSWSTESSQLPKMGKWKIISKLLVERGFRVSPQQCEDKFNNLNKGYKRLNDVLGKGTCCKVVENPKLLDEMDISEKEKEVVHRLLSSKHLFYKEMCSYHNGNPLFLLNHPELEWSIYLALGKKDEPHSNWSKADNEQDLDAIADLRVSEASNPMKFAGFNGTFETSPLYCHTDLNPVCPEGDKSDELQKQQMAFRSGRLRSQKLQLKAQFLKLEKQQFKWEGNCRKRDRELNKMRLQNESLKFENQRMATELKYKELTAHYKSTV